MSVYLCIDTNDPYGGFRVVLKINLPRVMFHQDRAEKGVAESGSWKNCISPILSTGCQNTSYYFFLCVTLYHLCWMLSTKLVLSKLGKLMEVWSWKKVQKCENWEYINFIPFSGLLSTNYCTCRTGDIWNILMICSF